MDFFTHCIESESKANNWFKVISVNDCAVGGEVEGPMGESPWGSYAGMFRDKYGIEWIIEFSATQ